MRSSRDLGPQDQWSLIFVSPTVLMKFIFRIDRYFSRVVNAILHPNDSNGSTNCAQYLSKKYAKQYFLAPVMIFISRIDNSFSRVVNAILHPNDSNGSKNIAQYLSHKICKAVFLSPTNDIPFSDRQLFFSGRKCHSPSERFERIDKLCTIPQPQNMQSSISKPH